MLAEDLPLFERSIFSSVSFDTPASADTTFGYAFEKSNMGDIESNAAVVESNLADIEGQTVGYHPYAFFVGPPPSSYPCDDVDLGDIEYGLKSPLEDQGPWLPQTEGIGFGYTKVDEADYTYFDYQPTEIQEDVSPVEEAPRRPRRDHGPKISSFVLTINDLNINPCFGLDDDTPRVAWASETPVLPCSSTEKPAFPVESKKRFLVTLKFGKARWFVAVLCASGKNKEYLFPVFTDLQPLHIMKKSPQYRSYEVPSLDPDVQLVHQGTVNQFSIKRYECRVTLGQLSIILGLQHYHIQLTRDIESIVLAMFDQLCGFQVGCTWTRGVSRATRVAMVTKVHKFASIFFPTFTKDVLELIAKRGVYNRNQSFERKRRREQRRTKNRYAVAGESTKYK